MITPNIKLFFLQPFFANPFILSILKAFADRVKAFKSKLFQVRFAKFTALRFQQAHLLHSSQGFINSVDIPDCSGEIYSDLVYSFNESWVRKPAKT